MCLIGEGGVPVILALTAQHHSLCLCAAPATDILYGKIKKDPISQHPHHEPEEPEEVSVDAITISPDPFHHRQSLSKAKMGRGKSKPTQIQAGSRFKA
jgi:hypothetical protein